MTTIHLVVRRDENDIETTLLGFETAELARQHAQDATELTSLEHDVRPLTLAEALPEQLISHQLLVDLELDGTERWRHESTITTYRGYPGTQAGADVTWKIVVRGAPSQPPSKIRVEVTGPDRDWCLAQVRDCWAQAQADESYQQAVVIEEMFTAAHC